MTASAKKTVATLLGASEFPNYKGLSGGQAFANSVAGFKDCLEVLFGRNWCDANVLDLFDSEEKQSEQLSRLGNFLREHDDATWLIVYYVGHGSIFKSGDYYLTLRVTEKDNEHISSLEIGKIAITIDKHFVAGNVVLILDCCFAGEAMQAFQGVGAIGKIIENKTLDCFPATGTSLLCASSKDEPAISEGADGCTMFSGTLIDVLRHGVPGKNELLSLRDLHESVEQGIRHQFGINARRPEVHSPRQRGADVAQIPLFRNVAYQPPEPKSIPENILRPLQNIVPDIRLGAVSALKRLANDADAEFLALIQNELHRLSDNDDSFSVRNAAAQVLGKLEPEGGPKGTSESFPRDVTEEEAQRVEEEAKGKAEEEARLRAEADTKHQAEEGTRRKAKQAAKRKAAREAKREAEAEEADRKAKQAEKRKAAREAKREAEAEEANRKAKQAAKRKAAREAKREAKAEEADREAERAAASEAEQATQREAVRERTPHETSPEAADRQMRAIFWKVLLTTIGGAVVGLLPGFLLISLFMDLLDGPFGGDEMVVTLMLLTACGATAGVMQSFLLKQYIAGVKRWVRASVLGWTASGVFVGLLLGNGVFNGWLSLLILLPIVGGAVTGGHQTRILLAVSSRANLWWLATTLAWPVGVAIGAIFGDRRDVTFLLLPVGGLVFWLVVTAATMAWLLTSGQKEAYEQPAK